MESRVGTRRELYFPTGEAGQAICEVCLGGSTEKAFHKLGWEIKAPDRAVTGQSLGVERWLSVSTVSNKAGQLLFQKSPSLPFLREA